MHPRKGRLDRRSSELIAATARLLRSISPPDGEVEMLLHDMARRLEQLVADAPDAPQVRPPMADVRRLKRGEEG